MYVSRAHSKSWKARSLVATREGITMHKPCPKFNQHFSNFLVVARQRKAHI